MKAQHEENINYNEEDELLEESQSRNKYALLFVGLGILATIIFATVFYLFLKNQNPPIEISSIAKSVIKHKEFKKDPLPQTEKELPLLPLDVTQEPKPKPKPKVYKSKIIKGGGGKLAIGQNVTEPKKKEDIKREKPKPKPKPKAYTGGISTVAGIHQYNQNLSLGRGTLIPCNLNTRLISMVSGQLSCTISEDIYSVNGNVLLIEKGSIAVGSYKSTAIQNGMNRMFAMWDDIRTPSNVIISIGSGTADELGSSGMVGEVDNHWLDRFGGAILVSLIDDGLAMFTQKHNNGQTYIVNSSTNNARSMSQQVLSQYINIPPTLYKNHGDLINIYVNKDIDFSEVYVLER